MLLPCFGLADDLSERSQIEGVVRDVFRDPTNPRYLFFYIQSSNETNYATAKMTNEQTLASYQATVGASVCFQGYFATTDPSFTRPYSAREFRVWQPKDLVITRPPPADGFSCPNEERLKTLSPAELSSEEFHRACGRVLAAWDENRMLIRTQDGNVIEAELRTNGLPRQGETVDVAGLPETTLYNLRLNRAIWRSVAEPDAIEDNPQCLTAAQIVTDDDGRSRMNIRLHGKPLRVRGIVRSLPKSQPAYGLLYLEDDGFVVPVDAAAAASALPGLQIGCTVEATGVCIMDVDVWRPNAVFPRIRGYKLVTRSPADIRVLAHPPWLTPLRMFVIVGVLVVIIIGILLWNYTLTVKSERRGRQLAKEQLLRLESELKVSERTRLAVELHDSIAQNLTGVSMEIDTALRGDSPLPENAAKHMGRALQTINSCRSELRNCLWDLRSQALEAKDMNEAIRLTLRQTIGKAHLNVRFNVPRSRFTDNTAHAILRIIRELAANAVRHGKATEIKVAGSIEDEILKFSVRDNGCGFDPDACPGVLQGHFGLQGVRERVASFEGDMHVESTPGKGARISISINAPDTEDNERI